MERRSPERLRMGDYLAVEAREEKEIVVLSSSDDGGGGGGDDLVEVTLELGEDARSVVVRSVTPTSAAGSDCGAGPVLSRSCSSTTSRIRRKFAWLTTPSPMTSGELAAPAAMSARDARRLRARLERTRSGAQRALNGLRFISRTTAGDVGSGVEEPWHTVERRFNVLSRGGFLSREDFGECIGMLETKEFAKGVFDALARRQGQNLESITRDQLFDFWTKISDQSFDARLQIFFDMVDTNADGRITREEVQELIALSASANKLAKLKEQAPEYAALIMEELDPENLGYIELWQLEALLLQRDSYMNNSRPLSTAGRMMGAPRGLARRIGRSLWCVAQENWQRVWVVLLWVAAMASLFTWKFLEYRRHSAFHVMGYCLPTAKGAAETLKLNMALVLLPVCRNIITFLRSTSARLLVPFDDNINFHKMIAVAIVGGTVIHAGTHLSCDFPRLIKASASEYAGSLAEYTGRERPSYGELVVGMEGATGVTMVALMAVAFTLATSGFRRNGVRLPYPLNRLTGFNAFWYSHHLLALVYVLLVLHGYFLYLVHRWYKKTTWMYVAVPLLLYLGERSLRALRSESYVVKISKVSVLPGNVLAVVMSKPHGFRYRSGQYIFLKCPTISPFEWHPFSITSAPGDGHLSVHIRTVGDWTEELRRVFTEVNSSRNNIGRAKFTDSGLIYQRSLPRLLVDGPYGAPAQNYTNYDVLLLVGLGIGATPFISILRDLLNNLRMEEENEDSNTNINRPEGNANGFSFNSNGSSYKKKTQGTSHALFYWVTREPSSLEWFKGVMNEVAEMDRKGVIEMHNHVTSVYEEGDARSTLITMVQALNHVKHGVDIVSGTRVRTHFARPNWNDVFERIASKHPDKTVGVFYCGMPVLSKELKRLSHELSQRTTTRFHFHKEYF